MRRELHHSLENKVTARWLGTGELTKQELLNVANRVPVNFGSIAKFLVDTPSFGMSPTPSAERLVIARADVLVPNPKGMYITSGEIERARNRKGLSPVYAEVALQLLTQRMVSRGERIFMNMEPIIDQGGLPSILVVQNRDNNLWLLSRWTEPLEAYKQWQPDSKIAFLLPEK